MPTPRKKTNRKRTHALNGRRHDPVTPGQPETMDGRERHLTAIKLLLNLDDIANRWHQKRWADLEALIEFAQKDAPLDLAQTDPALFRSLRAAITEYYIRGYGQFNLSQIKKIARQAT
jgi:hypothetical protein